jgi:hypothetical protein
LLQQAAQLQWLTVVFSTASCLVVLWYGSVPAPQGALKSGRVAARPCPLRLGILLPPEVLCTVWLLTK